MNLRRQVKQYAARIDALSLRERAILMLGAFMVMFLAWDWALMSEITARSKVVNAQIDTTRSSIDKLNQAIATTAQSHGGDPNDALRAQLEQTRERIAELDARLGERVGEVIPPAEMAAVLEDMLRRQGKLELQSVESLRPEALFKVGDETDAPVPASVYRHGLELVVEGRYLDVLEYLRELEALDGKFFWEAVELESDDYPSNRVRIHIYSLNLEEGWLGV